MSTKRAPALVLAVSAFLLALAACNTVSGAGRDIQSVGAATEDAAEDLKPSNQ